MSASTRATLAHMSMDVRCTTASSSSEGASPAPRNTRGAPGETTWCYHKRKEVYCCFPRPPLALVLPAVLLKAPWPARPRRDCSARQTGAPRRPVRPDDRRDQTTGAGRRPDDGCFTRRGAARLLARGQVAPQFTFKAAKGGGRGSVAEGGDEGYMSAGASVTPSPAERGGGGRPGSTRRLTRRRVEWRRTIFGVPCRPTVLFENAQPRATCHARRIGSRRFGTAATAAGSVAAALAADATVGCG